MSTLREAQLDAYLDRITEQLQHLRHLDLAEEVDLAQALDESQQVLGALALYRALLARTVLQPTRPLRRVA